MAETYTAEIRDGVVVFDEGTPPLPEGARLRIELIAEEGGSGLRTLAERLALTMGAPRKGLPTDMAEGA